MRGVNNRSLQHNPPLYLAIGFLLIIVVGGILLSLPISHTSGEFIPFINGLFTATSATCVTGLSVYNISQDFTLFGQITVLILIQIGGLGFMAMTVFIAFALNRKITISDRLVIKEQFGQESLKGMVKWIRYVVFFTLSIEAIGTLILATQWIPQYGVKTGMWYSVFHSISAFCNAGFDLFGDSMIQFQNNPIILIAIALLIIIGGLGFGVYMDLFTSKRKSLHTKLALSMTAILLVGGTILFLFLENGNAKTLEGQNVFSQVLNAFFQSATTRTAGFFSIQQTNMMELSLIATIILMLIGGSPAGTAGGMKTTTVAVLILSTIAQLRDREETEIFNRSISKNTALRATTIIILSLFWVMVVSSIISYIENIRFLPSIFETVSAFATVGLSMDLTTELGNISKVLLIISMYIGRVGPITIAYALFRSKKRTLTKNANGKVMVG